MARQSWGLYQAPARFEKGVSLRSANLESKCGRATQRPEVKTRVLNGNRAAGPF